MDLDFAVALMIAGCFAIAHPIKPEHAPIQRAQASTKVCNCAEYVHRKHLQVPDLSEYTGEFADHMIAAGYQQVSQPEAGAIARIPPGTPGLTGNTGHVAIIQSVDFDGVPIIHSANSGGNQFDAGCSNVAMERDESYLNQAVTYWAKN
ncbi:hypothetical protein JOY44_28720 (plasmid) [Phormidium sp. CLA17]|uniref:CHAP domain-containing protein n=1 Tax=Leptolyngbya sp. Cla-17 TaxID=2803751 RepID=UPI0014915C75|nr:CHAP domain-containing protein [Leptolyngbya sp. Cla-17]MBM0745411.1 hypothetical protein [Leptolyngbya sp. Cla-17]